jgi:thiosulfate dehydrogenase [quinone] large subunit
MKHLNNQVAKEMKMAAFNMTHREIQDPPLARFLFNDTRMAWLWLVVRIYLGYEWLEAGLHKMTPAWLNGGEALKGFWTNAVSMPETGRPPIAFDWYRTFIQFMLDNGWYTWFAKVVAFGEILIGVALILGAFVGIAAFFGALLNWNFIMAGAASTNAVLFTLAILLILAWKVAGFYGLDYYLLPKLGTPWKGEAPAEAPTNGAFAGRTA